MSWKVDGYHITLTRGDSLQVRFPLFIDGTEYELKEGDVARFAMADDEEVALEKTLSDSYVLTLDPEDTKDLEYGSYRYDCEICMAETGQVITYVPDNPTGKAKFTLTWEAM